MGELTRQFLIGAASIILAPAGAVPSPKYRITIPGPTATDAIAGDVGRVSADLLRAIRKVEKTAQLEFDCLEVG